MSITGKHILVTGAAGFIGFHLSRRLLKEGHRIVGLDNLNDYYDVELKTDRLAQLQSHNAFHFVRLDIADRAKMEALFDEYQFDRVIHLAAQAGVRYSLANPHTFIDSNLVGFVNVLEGCRHTPIEHLVFASSSSVYGANTRMPHSTDDNVDHPLSLYAATKKANELMAYTYAHLHGLPVTGLRFFSVYGPWGRPDMALFLFTKAILEGRPIEVFNQGRLKRDFTYVDDVVDAVVRVADKIPTSCSSREEVSDFTRAPYKIYNIGNSQPTDLMRFIEIIEENLHQKADIQFLPLQPGDVPATYANIEDSIKDFGFKPATSIEEGIRAFIEWFKEYYNV